MPQTATQIAADYFQLALDTRVTDWDFVEYEQRYVFWNQVATILELGI